ncbi:hypothetical protein [Escherichia coli]|uniref:hypothetical protein n=1 Tax=Escherichia coli TaxID=562 RepID=UPI001E2CA107|nr:hypothetical protein [Escherichia coli]
MKWFSDYIDELKEKLEITSDYGIAKHLGIARQTMTKIRNGAVLNSEMCFKIANELKRHPMEIIATARAQKERNNEFRAFWIKMAKEYGNK